ncbi:alpha-1,2-fucosyltransferase [Clostridia bacterium]|nr:alpha-1,2-fucosyltransferase [Clostridia bacterium]
MLIVTHSAGMGNQMFQYALAVYLRQRNRRVYLDVSLYEPPFARIHNGYDLYRAFRITDPLLDRETIRQLLDGRNARTIQQLNYEPFEQIQPMLDFDYDSTNPADDWAIGFYGFWQYKQLLEPIEQLLRRAFTFDINAANSRTRALLPRLSDTESVCLHIRRGDYIGSGLESVATPEYYARAFQVIHERVRNPAWFIFTDEPDWVRGHLRLPAGTIVVDWNRGEDSWQDMLLMSRCRHHVIPNSTFSWWGAWLAARPGQVVVQPETFIPGVDNGANYRWAGWVAV